MEQNNIDEKSFSKMPPSPKSSVYPFQRFPLNRIVMQSWIGRQQGAFSWTRKCSSGKCPCDIKCTTTNECLRPRLHAGCDIYTYENEPVYPVAPGKVVFINEDFGVRSKQAAQPLQAVLIEHTIGPIVFCVRYCEIELNSNIKINKIIDIYESIGVVKQVSFAANPMLHLELYSAGTNGNTTKKGYMNTTTKTYQRHINLEDPTHTLNSIYSWHFSQLGQQKLREMYNKYYVDQVLKGNSNIFIE